MKKIGEKIILALILMLMLISISQKVFASTEGYTIKNYDIDMVVNEDNTFDITEKIDVYFDMAKHGIYRKIPLRNSVKRLDGTSSSNRAKISNIKVSEEYSISQSNGYKILQIGSSSKTLTGEHSYIIKYTYNIGNDPLKNADELYFNLIGTEWDTTIEKVSFNITMPKEFDSSSLGFSSGRYATVDSSNVIYSVNENVINGFTKDELAKGEALTVRLTLPEGYFIEQKRNYALPIGIAVLGIICVTISYKLWKKYGKDRKPVQTVEFYPPDGVNSAELEFLYKGKASNNGIISLLIYLADKGYLKIEETEEKRMFGTSKVVKICKLREYDGENSAEATFFNGLFANKDIVTLEDLQEKFYLTIAKVSSKINSKSNREKIYDKTAGKKAIFPILMAVLIFVLITIIPLAEIGELEALPFATLFPSFGYIVIILVTTSKSSSKSAKIFSIIWVLGFAGIPILGIVLPILLEDKIYLITYIIGTISSIILGFFAAIMPRRTEYGTEMLGKIMGFKAFLETAEKTKLEALVMENPTYFFDILPYTYALGISNKWIKQFETIAIEPPDWYYCPDGFTYHRFERFMYDTMRPINRAMVSSPQPESSGGFSGGSGGGFSGGGSGGGGGGSW